MADLAKRLEAAKEKVKQLQAKLQKQEARRRALESKQERARDARRKVLLGAGVLMAVARGEWTKEQYDEFLKKTLTRPDDFALFGLPVPGELAKDAAPVKPAKKTTPKTAAEQKAVTPAPSPSPNPKPAPKSAPGS